MNLPFGVLSREEFNRRTSAGELLDNLVNEAKAKYAVWQDMVSQRQLRSDPRVSNEGNIDAGITPAGGSPVGKSRDTILDDIKTSARENPYTGYGDRYQALKELAATYQGREPVRGWERVKGLVSSGMDALAAGGNYGGAKAIRAAEDLADSMQRKATGGLTTGSPTTNDDALWQLAQEATRKDDAFRSYIYGRRPGTSSGPVTQTEPEQTDEAIRLKDWIFGKRPKSRG